jgi:hypothetical protein
METLVMAMATTKFHPEATEHVSSEDFGQVYVFVFVWEKEKEVFSSSISTSHPSYMPYMSILTDYAFLSVCLSSPPFFFFICMTCGPDR